MLLEIRRRILRQSVADIVKYRRLPRAALRSRLAQLERERSVARMVKANAVSLALAGMALGLLVHRRWLLLPAAMVGLALQLRRAGMRTRTEIEAERRVLAL